MANETNGEAVTPPYLPWQTFRGFVRDLKGKVVPPRIDRSLMGHMSGAGQSQLRTSLRFFGLVGSEQQVTDAFRALVLTYEAEGWKDQLRKLLSFYDGILEGVELKAATMAQLEEAFRERGKVDGSVLRKAVRFYLSLAEEAGAAEGLSPHFKGRRKGSGDGRRGGRRRASKGGEASTAGAGLDATAKPPAGVTELRPLPDKEMRVWLPNDLTDAEVKFAMRYLTNYLKLRKPD